MPMLERVDWQERVTNHHEYVINIAGKRIPLAVISANLKLIFTCVCIALAFQIGMYQQALITSTIQDNTDAQYAAYGCPSAKYHPPTNLSLNTSNYIFD